MIGVVTQPAPMCSSTRHWMDLPPRNRPMPRTAPTTACELETGTSGMVGSPETASRCSSPSEANRNSTIDWATTTTQAATGDSGMSSDPTVSITRLE